MSSTTDSVPLLLGRPSEPAPRPSVRDPRELVLMQRVAEGDLDAQRAVAERMSPRVSRVARTIMGGSLDARDAAQHALIELLRAFPKHQARARFERWVDRAAAVSVLRFARAVRRRDGALVGEAHARELAPGRERNARSFEQYLSLLSAQSREVLLLRHALGFPLAPLAEALQTSVQAAKEQLTIARRELRALVRRRAVPSSPGEGAQRWCTLRDREALGEALSASELAELAELEARDTEVWAYVAQVRALELFFDPSRVEPQAPDDHLLVERAVLALQVTAPSARLGAADSEAELERAMEPEGSRLVRLVALSASVGLTVASALALMLYRPGPVSPASSGAGAGSESAQQAAPLAHPTPTVEALTSVRTSRTGGRLRSGTRVLPEGTRVVEGESVESGERTGCLLLEPEAELCLPPWSLLRVSSLHSHERRFELLRGRAVVRIGEHVRGSAVHVSLADLGAGARAGAFAVERTSDGSALRARALEGTLEVQVGDRTQTLAAGRMLLYRGAGRAPELAELSQPLAQRDWDALAGGSSTRAAPLAQSSPATRAASEPLAKASPTEAGVTAALLSDEGVVAPSLAGDLAGPQADGRATPATPSEVRAQPGEEKAP